MSKVVGKNMSREKLTNKNFSDMDFYDCDFSGSDLRGANLSRCKLHRSNFRGANLTGVTITLSCHTFSKVQLDNPQVDSILYLLSIADISEDKRMKIIDAIGDKEYINFQTAFRGKT